MAGRGQRIGLSACRRIGVIGYWCADRENGRGDADGLGLPKAGLGLPTFFNIGLTDPTGEPSSTRARRSLALPVANVRGC
jgi:hypothetical protein